MTDKRPGKGAPKTSEPSPSGGAAASPSPASSVPAASEKPSVNASATANAPGPKPSASSDKPPAGAASTPGRPTEKAPVEKPAVPPAPAARVEPKPATGPAAASPADKPTVAPASATKTATAEADLTIAPRSAATPPPRSAVVAPPPRRWSGLWAAALLVLVLAALAASPFWAPVVLPVLPWGPNQQEAGAGAERLGALEARVQALESRPVPAPAAAQPGVSADQLRELRGQLDQTNQRVVALDLRIGEAAKNPPQAAQADNSGRLGELDRKLGQIESKTAELDRKIAEKPAVDAAEVKGIEGDLRKVAMTQTDLEGRLAKVEQAGQRETAADRGDQVLLLSLGRLREAVQTSRPYAAELGATRALAQNRPEAAEVLQALEPRAAKGLPSRAVLQQRFTQTAGEIVRAERAAPSEDWGDQALAKLKGLVTVRRVGQTAADGSPDAAVASAEAALKEGDLAGAVAALETLQGAPAEAAKPWLDDARARLAAEAALDKAEAGVTQRLAQSGSSEPQGKPR